MIGAITVVDLQIAEQAIDSYSQLIAKKLVEKQITKEQARKFFDKIDQWFKVLDYHWDRVGEG